MSTIQSPTATRPLRLILSGLGFWGSSWAHTIQRSRHWDLVALVDVDRAALERAAGAVQLDYSACFDSISSAASTIESDAVLVAVPPSFHAPLALEALENELHVLIEKPLAENMDEGRAIVEAAEAADRIAMVSQQYRHRPGARTVARVIRMNELGRVGSVHVDFADELVVRGFQHEMEEPLLHDMAIHHFDLVRAVLGLEPVRVQATSWNPPWSDFAGSASASVVLETAEGVVLTYTGTLAPRGPRTGWDGVWRVACERGEISWHGDRVVARPLERPFSAKVRRRLLGREWTGRRVDAVAVEEPDRLGSLAELAAAIREGREPDTSARDNLRSLALVFAAIESAREHVAATPRDPLG